MSPVPDIEQDIFKDLPDSYTATYLFRFPFGLGLDANRDHIIQTLNLEALAQGCSAAESQTYVTFKLLRIFTGGELYVPKNINNAARHFYDNEIPLRDPDLRFAPDQAYELWVSAETPLKKLPGEPDIPARTLERCLRAVDVLLRAYRLATRDTSVYPLGPAALQKAVPVGVRDADGQWEFQMMLFMRPESGIQSYPTMMTPQQIAAFSSSVQGLVIHHPFIRGKDLELTAYRQAYALDDLTSAVVSLQTSMESTLFELWRVSMVDIGMSKSDIDVETQSDKPFKTLVTAILPRILGGNWDVTATEIPVGNYWQDLYLLRNEVVHSGSVVQEWQYERALEAHLAIRKYIAQRLITKWRKYPRTLTAFVNARGLPPGLSLSEAVQIRMASILSEAVPFWLPQDIRQATSTDEP